MRSIRENLFKILVISIFLHTQNSLVASKSLKEYVVSICNNIENFPENFCDRVISDVKNKAPTVCDVASIAICENPLIFPLNYLFNTIQDCKDEVRNTVCNIADFVLEEANDYCVDEIREIIVGKGCDANGDEISICDGALESADGICTLVIDEACGLLPWFLSPLIPICQEIFSSLICSHL